MPLTLMNAAACGEPPALPEGATGADQVEVELVPESPATAAASVSRLLLEPIPADVGSIGLFEGTLSPYHLGRIASGELPSTLAERQVALQSWTDRGVLVLSPERILADGGSYSLAFSGGLLFEFTVREGSGVVAPLLRYWPPPGSAGEPRAIYCGAALPAELGLEPILEPGAVRASITRGVAPHVREDECLTLEAADSQAAGTVLLPPLGLGAVSLDPAPLRVAGLAPPEPGNCGADEAALGPGCARIGDDRLELAPSSEPWLWALRGHGLAAAEPVFDSPVVVKGLNPGVQNVVDITVYDTAARRWSGKVEITTAPEAPHIVINEVLANPLGAEPTQEWVELCNDGSRTVELEGWTLEDSGGRVSLPRLALSPGGYALVVADEYDAGAAFDVSPSPETPLLRVESLGRSGLRNSGEPLVLRDCDGAPRSAFPGIAAIREGVSAARRQPWAPDVSASFATHADPGASPGAKNVVDE